jgi:hypothetical protein
MDRFLQALLISGRPRGGTAQQVSACEVGMQPGGRRGRKVWSLRVAQGQDGKEKELATLSKNHYFGEIALLRDVPRTATVRTRGPTELYSLERMDFQKSLECSG